MPIALGEVVVGAVWAFTVVVGVAAFGVAAPFNVLVLGASVIGVECGELDTVALLWCICCAACAISRVHTVAAALNSVVRALRILANQVPAA